MKALTLQQPYALAGALGIKPWETRSKSTQFRGRHLITTSAKMDEVYMKVFEHPAAYNTFVANGVKVSALHFGAVIGHAEITDCVTTLTALEIMKKEVSDGKITKEQMEAFVALGDFSPGRFAYKWENAVKLDTPVPCKGALGIFDTRNIEGNYSYDFCSKRTSWVVRYFGQEVEYNFATGTEASEYIDVIRQANNTYGAIMDKIEADLFKL